MCAKKTSMDVTKSVHSVNSRKCVIFECDIFDVQVERELFLSMARAEYSKQLRSGMLPEHAHGAHSLFDSVDAARDDVHIELSDWYHLHMDIMGKHQGPLNRLVKTSYESYAETHTKNGCFDLFTVVNFLDAHHTVCELLERGDLGIPSKSRISVMEESAAEIEQAHFFLVDNMISVQQIRFVRTKQMAVAVLKHQKHQVDEWCEAGVVLPAEVECLLHPLHHAMTSVARLQDVEKQHSIRGSFMRSISEHVSGFMHGRWSGHMSTVPVVPFSCHEK